MGMVNGFRSRFDQPSGGLRVAGEVGQLLFEAWPADQLHAEVLASLIFAHLEYRHDVRVVQKRDCLSFILEPSPLIVAGQYVGLEQLQRDRAVQADLARLVHNPHAASAQFLDDLVITEVVQSDSGLDAGIASLRLSAGLKRLRCMGVGRVCWFG